MVEAFLVTRVVARTRVQASWSSRTVRWFSRSSRVGWGRQTAMSLERKIIQQRTKSKNQICRLLLITVMDIVCAINQKSKLITRVSNSRFDTAIQSPIVTIDQIRKEVRSKDIWQSKQQNIDLPCQPVKDTGRSHCTQINQTFQLKLCTYLKPK